MDAHRGSPTHLHAVCLCFAVLLYAAPAAGKVRPASKHESTVCPQSIIISGSFTDCVTLTNTFIEPDENMTWSIHPAINTTVRFNLESSVGAATMTLYADGMDWSSLAEDTSQGPGTVWLHNEYDTFYGMDSHTEWTLTVQNTAGFTTWWLQVTVIPAKMQLLESEKQILRSWFDECCDPEYGRTYSFTCGLLHDWSMITTDTTTDACQSTYASCSAAGELVELKTGGMSIFYEEGDPWGGSFNQRCTAKPPASLKNFKALTQLDLSYHGLYWTLDSMAELVSSLPALEHLYLGYNVIGGELDEKVCSMFKGSLTTFSLPSDPYNFETRISGPVHPCVVSGSLEALDLTGQMITSLPAIPVGSPLQTLKVKQQQNANGLPTMTGSIQQSLVNANQLGFLDLSRNGLTGPLPTLPISLQVLDLSYNDLSGAFPSSFKQAKELVILNLQNNPKIATELSQAGLENLGNLTAVLLGNTRVSGDLDSVDWSQLQYLSILQLKSTQVSGQVPASLARLPRLQVLDLSNNRDITRQASFAGALGPSNQINLYLVANCSITDLPDSLFQLAVFQSESMYLSTPDWEPWMDVGKAFDVSGNRISGIPIPTWLMTHFPAETCFMWYSCFLDLQSNTNQHENSMTCPLPTAHLDADQVATSQEVFALKTPETKLYCLDQSGQPVPIAHTLQLSESFSPQVLPPNATATADSYGIVSVGALMALVASALLLSMLCVSLQYVHVIASSRSGYVNIATFEQAPPLVAHAALELSPEAGTQATPAEVPAPTGEQSV